MKYILKFILIAIVFYSCNPPKGQDLARQSRSLPVMELKLDSITLYTEYPARVEGKVNVDIRSRIDGYIQTIYVEEGSYVKAGQALFKIDDRSYTETLNSAKAQLANAELEVNKYRMLSQNNVTSDFQLKTAEAAYLTAKSAVETARINLGFTRVKAPVNGFIGFIPKRIGNLVAPSDAQPLTTLSDINEVYTYFSMSEKEFLLFNSQYQGENMNEKIAKMESDNKTERIAITISGKQGDFYAVKDGLNAGDRIISKELETVTDGETIQPEIQE